MMELEAAAAMCCSWFIGYYSATLVLKGFGPWFAFFFLKDDTTEYKWAYFSYIHTCFFLLSETTRLDTILW